MQTAILLFEIIVVLGVGIQLAVFEPVFWIRKSKSKSAGKRKSVIYGVAKMIRAAGICEKEWEEEMHRSM